MCDALPLGQGVEERGKGISGRTSGHIVNGTRCIDKYPGSQLGTFMTWLPDKHRSYFDISIHIPISLLLFFFHGHASATQPCKHSIRLYIETFDELCSRILPFDLACAFRDSLLEHLLDLLVFVSEEGFSDWLSQIAHLTR